MVDLDAGELTHRVIIQSRLTVPNNESGSDGTWTTVATVWAGISPMRAKQVGEYASRNVHATHLLKMRGAVNIQEGNRIVYGTRIFEVQTVENEKERGVKKWVTCKERRA